MRGTIQGLLRGTVVIDVNGVGYRVAVTAATLTSLAEGQEVLLWTHLAVRENSQDLYGFMNKEDLQWFEMLLTVSGVGPKSALAIVNAVDTATLQSAIGRNDHTALSGTYGIGKKTAEKIVLELREKVGALEPRGTSVAGTDGEVVDALLSLGFSAKEARDAAREIPKGLTSTEDKIREAIKLASRG